MRRIYPVLTCLVLALSAPGAGAAELGADLGGLLAYAHEHNPDLRQRTLEAEAAHAGAPAASALPDPSFQVELMDVGNAASGGSASLLPGQVGTTRYLITQPLPFYGKRDLRGRAAESKATQSDASRDAAQLEIESGIKTAYARYYQATGQARILTETRQLYDGLEKVVLTRYGVGLVPQQDAIQIQSEVTAVQVDLIDAERKRREAMAALNALLARDAEASLAEPQGLPRPNGKLTLDGLRTALLDHSPDLARDQAAIEMARADQALTLRDRYPDFDLGVRDSRPKNGTQSWDVMLTMTIPLQQSARRSREAESGYKMEAAQVAREATRAKLVGRLGQALAGYEGSRDQATMLRGTLLPQSRANLKAAQAGYETGQVNFNTLIQAERQILKTRLDLLNAETETAVRLSELEQLTGSAL
jgi:outer membrane protein TolC